MSFNKVGETIPKIAASAIGQYVALTNDLTVDDQTFPAGSVGQEVIGVSIATVPTYGYAAAVAVAGDVKMIVAASVGAGARVAVASTNGAIGPISASGLATALGSALGAGGAKFSVGWVWEARLPGEYATVHIDPRQVI